MPEQDTDDRYEVVLCGDDGYAEEHAKLVRKQLVNDGFYDDVVEVRPAEVSDDG